MNVSTLTTDFGTRDWFLGTMEGNAHEGVVEDEISLELGRRVVVSAVGAASL